MENPPSEDLLLESVVSQVASEFSNAADKIDDELEDQILAALKKFFQRHGFLLCSGRRL